MNDANSCENFSLLTDTYLYAYDTSGAQNYALKHGYSHPEQTTNEKRILLYDKLAYNFALYSKSSLIYQKALEDKIVYASVGDDSLAAIVTQSKRYANILYIYDDGGNWLYTKKFADENVMQVCSEGDGEHIIVSTVSASQGDILTNFYRFSVKSAEDPLWKYTLRTGSLPCGLSADRDKVIAVCDNCILSLSTASGEQNGLYAYSGTLKNFHIGDDRVLVHYSDISTYLSTEAVGFVTGARDLATFDDFVETLKSMGAERCLEIRQQSLDRYYSKALN